MGTEKAQNNIEARRQWMIDFIVKVVKQTDDKKLSSIYNFVLHIQ